MAKLNVTDLAGANLGEIEVADEVFAAQVKEHLLWEVVRYQRAARRAGTHSTKTRAEVHLTGKKMTKQKGTGGARHGSRRSNIFRGGGSVHGPRPRSYAFSVNKKVMAGALRSALTLRAQKGDLLVVRELALPEIKTKALFQALAKLQAPKTLLVDSGENKNLRISAQNLASSSFLDVRGLNVYDILRFPKLLISETSLRAIEARLNKTAKPVSQETKA
ncbi:MAG: 50S ribosomal protein L4 [Nannocystis sp.]|uniref:50S ribosomal protein L4 n=1 Tax=Nannocystis sp. TaxID=1962667 RepID=UPI002421C079|nr:50S ribosomal protein L4 [Nannocystis sp.]MBK9754764.1 50S ribosomal protein L4 [Nannocystis sp.]